MHSSRLRNAVIGSLLSASLAAGGCYQYCPKGSPLITWRGHAFGMTLKREGNEFRMKNILISCRSKMPTVCVTAPFESSRKKAIAELKERIKHLDYLNLKNPKVVAMIENNLYLVGQEYLASHDLGTYMHGADKMHGIVVKDEEGHTICSNVTCANFDLLVLRPRGHHYQNTDSADTFIHEHLHDAWHSVLSDESKRSFLAILQRIISIGGNAEEADRFFRSIDLCKESSGYDEIASALDFVEHRFSSLGATEKADLGKLVLWYFHIRRTLAHGAFFYNRDNGLSREKFMKQEGYPYAFEYSGGFLNEFYTPIISEKGLKEQRIGYEISHLSSKERFEKMVPVLDAYTRYIMSRPPEYWKEIKKINTEEDIRRFLRRKYEPQTS
jgi:hypothetical protein